MSLFRKISYYVPLVPRLGTFYHLSTSDILLLEQSEKIPGAKRFREELLECTKERIIPIEDFHHYIVGGFFRIGLYALFLEDSGVAIMGSGLCFLLNESYNYALDLQTTRSNLQEMIECQERETKDSKS